MGVESSVEYGTVEGDTEVVERGVCRSGAALTQHGD